MNKLLLALVVPGVLAVVGCSAPQKHEEAPPPPPPPPAAPAAAAPGTCTDNAQCASFGACGRCDAGKCVKVAGCCATDGECNGGRCKGGMCH